MTAYELAVNMYNNTYEPEKRLSVDEAAWVLREYRLDDEDGELSNISAEDLADEYNALVDESMRINAEEDE